MRSIHELTELFASLPGIGPRQARRIVQFIIAADPSFREKLANFLKEIGSLVSQCPSCFRFAEMPRDTFCKICADNARDRKTLMVVEKDIDIDGVEATDAYQGLYFVLGALIPMARQKKNGPSPRKKELYAQIEKNDVSEIIFALSTTPEGDYTAREIMRELKEKYPEVKTNLLGRGLSVGAEIEYADQETIRNALKNRA